MADKQVAPQEVQAQPGSITEAQVDAQLKMAELQLERDQKRAVAIGPT